MNPLNNLPGSRNTVVQRNSSGPTAFKWSKRAGRVTTCETPSRHAGRSTGRGGAGGPPPPAGPAASTTDPPIPPRPTPPSTLEGDSSGPSQPVSASSAPPNDYPHRTWEASDASRVTFQRPSEVLEYD